MPGDPVPSFSDVEHTIQYASLVCRSPEAAEKFISLAEQMADDLLRLYGHVIIALDDPPDLDWLGDRRRDRDSARRL